MEQPARAVEVSPARPFIRLENMPPQIAPLERLILTAVQQRGPCSYADLEAGTGLSRRALMEHCKRLEGEGYIEREYGQSAGGGYALCQIRLADTTPRQPRPAPPPPTRPPDCDIAQCQPPAAAAFKAIHSSGRIFYICNPCGESLLIPADKRHKLDD